MATISTREFRDKVSDTVNRAAYGGERIFLQRRGKNVAAIVPVADVELLEELEDRMDLEAARKALAEPGESIPWAEVEKRLDAMKEKKRALSHRRPAKRHQGHRRTA